MQQTHQERSANVRRNLRRWRKTLQAMMAGWVLLTLALSIGAVTHAHANHYSQNRVKMLAEGCGAFLVLILAVTWLAILVIADRRRSE